MTHCRLERLAQRHHLLVHGIPGRRLAVLFHRLFTAVNAVFLNLAGVDFRKPHVAEERNQMDAQPSFVVVHIDFIALAFA